MLLSFKVGFYSSAFCIRKLPLPLAMCETQQCVSSFALKLKVTLLKVTLLRATLPKAILLAFHLLGVFQEWDQLPHRQVVKLVCEEERHYPAKQTA